MTDYFKVWFSHKAECFDVIYKANSYGARDIERARKVSGKRVIVLGDSFVEGFGMPLGKRMSDLLEKASGLEHLNFGTAGNFGPTQYYLLYKTLAKKFKHDAVLVGILPANDFYDDDYDYGKVNHRDQYRPYWTGAYPNYKLVYFQSQLKRPRVKTWKGFLREFTYTYPAWRFLKKSIIISRLARVRSPAHEAQPAGNSKDESFYDKFTDEQFNRLRYSLENIAAEARDSLQRDVLVITIPTLKDLK